PSLLGRGFYPPQPRFRAARTFSQSGSSWRVCERLAALKRNAGQATVSALHHALVWPRNFAKPRHVLLCARRGESRAIVATKDFASGAPVPDDKRVRRYGAFSPRRCLLAEAEVLLQPFSPWTIQWRWLAWWSGRRAS